MLTGEDEYVVSSIFSRYHSFTKIASHLFPLLFRYGTVNFNSMRKRMCALFITDHLKVS